MALRVRRQPIEAVCVDTDGDNLVIKQARGTSLHIVEIKADDYQLIGIAAWVHELLLRRARKHEGLMKELLAARNG